MKGRDHAVLMKSENMFCVIMFMGVGELEVTVTTLDDQHLETKTLKYDRNTKIVFLGDKVKRIAFDAPGYVDHFDEVGILRGCTTPPDLMLAVWDSHTGTLTVARPGGRYVLRSHDVSWVDEDSITIR